MIEDDSSEMPAKTEQSCWAELLYGKACCLWNCIFAPCVLSFWSCAIYCCGCLRIYATRNAQSTLFKDADFPANAVSLGDLQEDVIWLRATKYARTKSLQLVDETINIHRLCQGASGETWLLSAIACIGERRALHHLFESVERSSRGKYILKLFDGVQQQWQRIIIDDRIPCDRAAYENDKSFHPSFLTNKENDLFLLLIEKAFAKFMGGYQRLKEGSTAWALSAMTGDPTRIFVRSENGMWTRKELEDEVDADGQRSLSLFDTGVELAPEVLFEVLRKYCLLESVLCAAGANPASGLHPKHAYSILDVRKVQGGIKLGGGEWQRAVQMRNIWPSGKEKSLSRKSSQLRSIAREKVEFDDHDDSILWMSWEDFLSTWRTISVVDPPSGIGSLRLQVSGGSPLAPAAACLVGCCSFWCGLGCHHLYCPYRVVAGENGKDVGTACCCFGARSTYAVRSSELDPGASTMLGLQLEKE